MELAVSRLFRAKWTEQIHEEWISNLLVNRHDLDRRQLDRTRELMNAAVLDAVVTGYEDLVRAIELPDPNDRHVLAAAIASNCDAIVTANLKDFPPLAVSTYGIEIRHPDEFLHHLLGLNDVDVVTAARRCRSRLRNPTIGVSDYLAVLRAQGLPKTVDVLTAYVSIL